MFRLIRFLFTFLICVAIWWAATTYQLGSKTLWGHMKAIAGSKESKQLVDEVKKKAGEVKVKVKQDGKGAAKKASKKVKKEVKDRFSDEERKALREVIKEKLKGEEPARDKEPARGEESAKDKAPAPAEKPASE